MRRAARNLLLASVFTVLSCGLAAAADPVAPPDVTKLELTVPDPVRLALQDAKYAEAVKAIDEAIAGKETKDKDYLAYLKGRALHLQQKYDDAIATFDAVEKQFPESKWIRRAKFGRAVSLMRKGDFRAAEEIYKSAADYLLSVDRRHEIAGIYLEFAEKFFKPKEEGKQPDYRQALTFFNQALEVGPKPERRTEVELAVAQCHQHLGELPQAAQLYEQFAKKYPKHELVVEALFRRGECLMGQGNPAAARRVWQDLLSAHAESKSERIPEAAYNVALTYGIPNPASDEALNLGVGALVAFATKYPEHKLASKALLAIGESYMARQRSTEAVAAFQKFLADERYKEREEIPVARRMLGYAYVLQKKFTEALAAWQDYLAKHPAHQDWNMVQRAIIDTEYLMGQEKRQAKEYDAARQLWTAFLAKYPLEDRNRHIMLEFGQMQFDQGKFPEAIAEWRRLVSKYPQTEESSQAQFQIAATLEDKLSQFTEALKEYRALNWGGYVGPAQQRIARLTSKSIAIVTERVFRSDETPKVVVDTRNIDSINVRAYTVDLETYFRKMHLARGVESLDTALIDPDKSFDHKVGDYVEHKAFKSEVDVPLPGGKPDKPPAGVIVVTVSSTNREATTLLIQSDLDVIVKSSRDEVFVFAQNMRTGKPWAGVKLLVSNGAKVFAEATTGADGVFQGTFPELKDAGDVRVFSVAEGHVASNVVDLSGVGVAQGLEDKGYIYTDRPAYRSGQIVHVRGVVRRAKDDAYTVEKGGKYALEIYDSRNRSLYHQDLQLSEFGSFHARFTLPPSSVPGAYRVQVTDQKDKAYQGEFLVHEYQLEPVQLVVESDRSVYYRGEEITGKIKAQFYYGAPLAGREIRYQLADGDVQTATTDAAGEVPFKFPTRDFQESQVLPLVVTLPERNLASGRNFYLATQGFSLAISTVRSVYLSGESFEATIKATDAEGKPIAQKLTLTASLQTNVQGRTGETLVEKHEIETDKEGNAKKTLTLQKGGTYIVRAEGIDRFGNAVSQQHAVQISDDSDAVRLRILADKHTFKVGDTAQVQLHWREKPALALVTYQGARVLGYQLVELQTGANKLEIPMTARLAPNFELSVAVMTDTRKPAKPKEGEEEKPIVRFHTASSPFAVERDLQLKVTTRRKADAKGPMRPGEEIEIVVITTDPQGKPVAAEVSLAMVEQALLDRFKSGLPSIGAFFKGQDRETAVRTTSSITFEYRPATRDIDPNLLTERDRLELREEEAARLGAARELAGGGTTPAFGAFNGPSGWPKAIPPAGNASEAGAARYGAAERVAEEREEIMDRLKRRSGLGRQAGGQQGQGHGLDDLAKAQSLNSFSDSEAWAAHADGSARFKQPHGNARDDDGDGILALGQAYHFSPNGADHKLVFEQMAQRGYSSGIVLLSDGKQANLNFAKLRAGDFEKLGKELQAAGAVLLPAAGIQETGYWAPAVVTNDKGEAVLTVTLPERSTAWKLLAKGVSLETLAGEHEGDLLTKKDLFGELKLPMALASGDESEVIATVHNAAQLKGAATVTFKAAVGEKSMEETKTVALDGKAMIEVPFKVKFDLPEAFTGQAEVRFELTVKSAEQSDVVRNSIALLPPGIPVYATASGASTSDTTAWVEAPKDMPLSNRALQVIVGSSVERSLLEIVTGSMPACQMDYLRVSSGLDTAVGDLMASLGLLKLIDTSREPGSVQAHALDSRIRSSLGLLVSIQQDDGS